MVIDAPRPPCYGSHVASGGAPGRKAVAPGPERAKALDQKRLTTPNLIRDAYFKALDLTRSRASVVKSFAFLPAAVLST